MAFHPTFLVLALLSIAFAVSSAQILTVSSGILGGVLTCTNTSLATVGTFPVLSQVRVDLVCGSGSLARVVQSVLTNTAGVYTFVFTSADTILNDPGRCQLITTVPAVSCFLNIPSAILRIPIVVLGTVDALVGRLLVLGPGSLNLGGQLPV